VVFRDAHGTVLRPSCPWDEKNHPHRDLDEHIDTSDCDLFTSIEVSVDSSDRMIRARDHLVGDWEELHARFPVERASPLLDNAGIPHGTPFEPGRALQRTDRAEEQSRDPMFLVGNGSKGAMDPGRRSEVRRQERETTPEPGRHMDGKMAFTNTTKREAFSGLPPVPGGTGEVVIR